SGSTFKTIQYKEFDPVQCENRKIIAHGGFSHVYSAVFQGQSYALKRLIKNDNEASKLLKREISDGLREKEIINTPLNYVDLYNQCWSSEPSQRPTLDTVLDRLQRLQSENIEFITHIINENWIKHFGLHKGRNFNGNDFVLGSGVILRDNDSLE
ncbi:21380_t:CDS:2, partial [Racocetra persica]